MVVVVVVVVVATMVVVEIATVVVIVVCCDCNWIFLLLPTLIIDRIELLLIRVRTHKFTWPQIDCHRRRRHCHNHVTKTREYLLIGPSCT